MGRDEEEERISFHSRISKYKKGVAFYRLHLLTLNVSNDEGTYMHLKFFNLFIK